MEEKEKYILEFMNSKEYVSMNIKEIMHILGVPNDERNELEQILNKLEEEGKIIKTNKNKYITTTSQGYVSGVFRANEKGFGFITVSDDEPDLYVSKEDSLNALNGDNVLAKIMVPKSETKKAEAKIIKITKRNTDKIIGRFEYSRNFGFVIPDDIKIINDVFISKKNMCNAKDGDKVIVKIINWATDNKKTEGEIVEILGKADDPKMDYVSVVNMFDLESEFSDDVIKEAQSINQNINPKEIENRKDLRDENIITIDGADTKDIDDAICVKKLNDNLYELGVHIADVSHYVREGSNLDKTAISRGTSVYLINKVIPMLPRELSNGICSLNEGVDRLALSITMTIDNNGKVIDSQIYKSVIRSKKKCVYTDVTDIIENKENAKIQEYSEFLDMIKYMNELKEILQNKRVKRGSIEFDLFESKIELDENDIPVNVTKRERGIADEIIEEFMLCANETIAETFFHLDAPFIYRNHDIPDDDKITTLAKILNNLNIKIKGMNKEIHPKTLQDVLFNVKDKENGKMISSLILRSMQLARYSKDNIGHFGLAAKYYCHFTSPIRRYPDLFIHRVISSYIDNEYNLKNNMLEKYQEQAEKYAKSSSDTERNAEKAEREFDDIKKCEYMQDKIGEEYEGVISSLTSFGMFIELDNTIEGLVRYEAMTDDYYDFDENTMCIIGRRTHKRYIIGDKIRIKVIEANKKLRRIDFDIIEENK